MEARERAAVWVRTLRLVLIAVPRRELKLLSFIGLTNGGARGAGRVHGDGIMQRAKRVVAPFEDYFVIIKRCVDHRKTPQTRWTWEIQRRSKPLGVKSDGDEYATAQDAKLAGETALKDLLHNLPR